MVTLINSSAPGFDRFWRTARTPHDPVAHKAKEVGIRHLTGETGELPTSTAHS